MPSIPALVPQEQQLEVNCVAFLQASQAWQAAEAEKTIDLHEKITATAEVL
jgi:hypothetical protein